ncbi:uncharacterized protein LOC134542569 isoform X1 [Bacillus rossius redtenbacheri]|uniref:uncharacterized protein LOC134542569 isoform X1 n=1 Tax=Bacillus rossius redtenbacheri TaxID=93214 RepID=UPI002FDE6E7A
MAYQLCVRNNIAHPFTNGETAGRAWFDHFMSRHKESISILKPSATSSARANGFNREAVNTFYDLLEAEFQINNYSADRVFNVDESGISVVQSKVSEVVGLRGKRQIGALTAAERGSLVTCIFSMNASGLHIPPMLIFPRKNMPETLMRGAPPGSIGRCHPSGWIQTNLFTDWFNHFLSKAKPTADEPILLILDGHHTHTKNIDVIELARANHVMIVSLPPHTTHKLQPLDRSFMGPLKYYYSENIRQWQLHNNRPLGPYDIAELLGNAFLKCQTGEIAASGFSVTGIFPFNRHLFSDVDFAPSSEEANVEDISLEVLKACKGRTTHKKTQQSTSRYSTAAIATSTSRSAASTSGPAAKNLTPSAKDLVEAGPSGCSSSMRSDHVSPQDILPIPRPKKRMTNKGPKPMKCAVITSSPYKLALEGVEQKRNEKLTTANEATTKKKNTGKETVNTKPKAKKWLKRRLCFVESSDENQEDDFDSGESVMEAEVGNFAPDDEDAVCLFCEQVFSKDCSSELWVQCMICEMWAHNLCAGADRDVYICDFCK